VVGLDPNPVLFELGGFVLCLCVKTEHLYRDTQLKGRVGACGVYCACAWVGFIDIS
jgi:hypothetical protein